MRQNAEFDGSRETATPPALRIDTPTGYFVIRGAHPDDATALAGLIAGLARYERLEAHCKPDPSALRRHLSPDARPRLEALIAESEHGTRVGFALYFTHYSTFLTNWGIYLEDLFVEPEYRGRGIGFALFRQVARIAADRGCLRMEWSVLDWNAPARDFYARLGAEELRAWRPMRLSGEALIHLAESATGDFRG